MDILLINVKEIFPKERKEEKIVYLENVDRLEPDEYVSGADGPTQSHRMHREAHAEYTALDVI